MTFNPEDLEVLCVILSSSLYSHLYLTLRAVFLVLHQYLRIYSTGTTGTVDSIRISFLVLNDNKFSNSQIIR